MESLFWHLANRTAETHFIFNLFHLLLSGLTLLVLIHQLRAARGTTAQGLDRLLPLGFLLLVLHFALLTTYFGAEFFFRSEWEWGVFERLAHGLMACGLLLVVAAILRTWCGEASHVVRWTFWGAAIVAGIVIADVLMALSPLALRTDGHSAAMLSVDFLTLLALGIGIRAVLRGDWGGRRATLVALASTGAALLFHSGPVFLPLPAGILLWNAEEHLLSIALFAFAWAAGERSGNLLDRVFVRLNLTFIILASLIMLITAGMEKYQYLRLAEERSTNLAEFLRGHVVYYRGQEESLEQIFKHPEVLKRVVVEFGTLPELREINVYLDGQRASFRYTADWEIQEEIGSLSKFDHSAPMELSNSFQMIRLPIASGVDPGNRIEFQGTMDYINEYIGAYIILIYSLFTIMVGLGTGIIGIIVADTDRRLRRQYAELQATHERLAQAAKLASVGELAGGMAHEINNPITSILSLSSHLVEDKSKSGLRPRQHKNLEVIAQQAQRVSKIVGNLLTFSRQTRLEQARVDMEEVLDTAITLVQFQVRDSGIQLRREFATGLPLVSGDAGRLTEVFVNLLQNAIDSMPNGGGLGVQANPNRSPGGGLRIEVSDTGCGIRAEDLPRIFDPFFTTKEAGRGTGLGLSISHGIIKDHGGQVWAESRMGVGTTVTVILPKEVS